MDEGFMALAAEATAGVLAACARTTLSEQLDSGDGGAMGAYSSSGGGGQRAGGGAHQRRMSVTAGVQVRMNSRTQHTRHINNQPTHSHSFPSPSPPSPFCLAGTMCQRHLNHQHRATR